MVCFDPVLQDAEQITFVSWRNDNFNWKIHIMNAGNTHQTNITNNGNVDDITLAWR